MPFLLAALIIPRPAGRVRSRRKLRPEHSLDVSSPRFEPGHHLGQFAPPRQRERIVEIAFGIAVSAGGVGAVVGVVHPVAGRLGFFFEPTQPIVNRGPIQLVNRGAAIVVGVLGGYAFARYETAQLRAVEPSLDGRFAEAPRSSRADVSAA